ncbi:hypothetical protein [Ottowia thiooxydans]|nr:hypothetical protein [Ottowia thiooxydans]
MLMQVYEPARIVNVLPEAGSVKALNYSFLIRKDERHQGRAQQWPE